MSQRNRILAMDNLRKYEGGTVSVSYFDLDGYHTNEGKFVRLDPYVCISVDDKSIPFVGFDRAVHRIKVGRRTVYENEFASQLPARADNPALMDERYVSMRKRTFGESDKLKEIVDQER